MGDVSGAPRHSRSRTRTDRPRRRPYVPRDATDAAGQRQCGSASLMRCRSTRRPSPSVQSSCSSPAAGASGRQRAMTGPVGSSTGAGSCTSSATAGPASRSPAARSAVAWSTRRDGWLVCTNGRPSGGTKAGSWGCVGADPALVPDAATLLVGWAHQQSLAGVPRKVRF